MRPSILLPLAAVAAPAAAQEASPASAPVEAPPPVDQTTGEPIEAEGSEILVIATPTWLGQPSSIAKRALERMDAFLSETREDGETPVAYNRVAGVVVTGNEDGAHHIVGTVSQAGPFPAQESSG